MLIVGRLFLAWVGFALRCCFRDPKRTQLILSRTDFALSGISARTSKQRSLIITSERKTDADVDMNVNKRDQPGDVHERDFDVFAADGHRGRADDVSGQLVQDGVDDLNGRVAFAVGHQLKTAG